MTQVGIRSLRDHLSRYLDQVQAGEELVVTDRGRAIARVVPVDGERAIDRLIAEGVITPPPEPRRRRPKQIRAGGTVSDLVVDKRR